jgi:hypothetical protein
VHRRGSSSEEIDQEPVNFQGVPDTPTSVEKDLRNQGITSFQEQPHKYSHFNYLDKPSVDRNIRKEHFDMLKKDFYPEHDGETTESVPLSIIPSEKDKIDYK